MYQTTGWYRPHYNSYMQTLNRPVGQVNREQLIRSIYKCSLGDRIATVDAFLPTSTVFSVDGPTNLSFFATPMKPVSHTLEQAWYLDGTNLPGQAGTNLLLSSFDIGNGSHTVSNSTWDPTTLVLIHTNQWFLTDPLIGGVAWKLTLTHQRTSITTLAGAHGSVTPSGTVVIPYGAGTSFVAQADAYYHLNEILTNETPVTLTNPVSMGYSYSNLRADSTTTVSFAENRTSKGTPEWWLATHYPATNDFESAATSDTDGDRAAAWCEYIAGTDPTNPASWFRILNITNGVGSTVRFPSSTDRWYRLEYRTNLVGPEPWSTISGQNWVTGNGALFGINDTNSAASRFYRVRVQLP